MKSRSIQQAVCWRRKKHGDNTNRLGISEKSRLELSHDCMRADERWSCVWTDENEVDYGYHFDTVTAQQQYCEMKGLPVAELHRNSTNLRSKYVYSDNIDAGKGRKDVDTKVDGATISRKAAQEVLRTWKQTKPA